MEKVERIILMVIALLILYSCDKENAPECLQTKGDHGSLAYLPTEAITEIILYDNIGVNLKNSGNEGSSFTLSGGENLLNDISFELENGVLTITNDNKCNWSRKYSPFLLNIQSNSLRRIYNYGSEGVVMENFNSSHFVFEQESSLADNYLDFIGGELTVNFHSSAGFAELTGTSENLFLYANGLSSIDGSGILSPSILANNSGRTNIMTAPTDYMYAYIGGSGSVLYNNLSASITAEIVGSGELVYTQY